MGVIVVNGCIFIDLRIVEKPEHELHSSFIIAEGQQSMEAFIRGEQEQKDRDMEDLLHVWKASAKRKSSCLMNTMSIPNKMFCAPHQILGLELVVKQSANPVMVDSFWVMVKNMQELERLEVNLTAHFSAPLLCVLAF